MNRPANAPASRRLLAVLVALASLAGACATSDAQACDINIVGGRPGLCLSAADARPAGPTSDAPLLPLTAGVTEADIAAAPRDSIPDHRGRVLVLNFWASWCGPCRAEQPALNAGFATLANDDIDFLGVAIGQDTIVGAQNHYREFGVQYPTLFDPANIFASRFEGVGPRAIPTTIFIDKQGRVALRLFGETTAGELIAVARALSAEG